MKPNIMWGVSSPLSFCLSTPPPVAAPLRPQFAFSLTLHSQTPILIPPTPTPTSSFICASSTYAYAYTYATVSASKVELELCWNCTAFPRFPAPRQRYFDTLFLSRFCLASYTNDFGLVSVGIFIVFIIVIDHRHFYHNENFASTTPLLLAPRIHFLRLRLRLQPHTPPPPRRKNRALLRRRLAQRPASAGTRPHFGVWSED
ncbi:hypothetical protein C8J55DRAFT_252347 [Lentinula edodes]|uniref:Uncharacterized protein n=1 Tax=Lentinula lateritia TaxID=40482 RepID=A0A9W9AWF4_9AGAR|nr:hypothetical protein C8J55DRAFT_252347 [Lentinula edodes]